jgi:hypothetical protein
MLASTDYPILDFFLTMLYFFLFFIWIWLLVMVFFDVFRSRDLGGGAKALWVIFIIILPFLGVFVYLIAGTPGADTASQLSKLADLKNQGVLTEEEFQSEKSKLLNA